MAERAGAFKMGAKISGTLQGVLIFGGDEVPLPKINRRKALASVVLLLPRSCYITSPVTYPIAFSVSLEMCIRLISKTQPLRQPTRTFVRSTVPELCVLRGEISDHLIAHHPSLQPAQPCGLDTMARTPDRARAPGAHPAAIACPGVLVPDVILRHLHPEILAIRVQLPSSVMSVTSKKFIAGLPIKPATKTLLENRRLFAANQFTGGVHPSSHNARAHRHGFH